MDNGIVAYKCPSCGAPLSYTTESQDFSCPYCGSHFQQSQLDGPLEGSVSDMTPEQAGIDEKQRRFGEENRLYTCPGCGAAIITDSELDASAECVYCHSPVVLSGRISGEFRPDKIIPFKQSRGEAIMGFNKWTKAKKFFLAKGFGSSEHISKIQGIYIPFWLADTCVEGKMTAECFKTIGSTRSGDYIIKTESKSIADREGSIIYQGVPADGSSKAEDALMDSIEPFDYRELVDFDMSYLSGHSALRYDVSKDQVYDRINYRVRSSAQEVFRNSINGYSRVNVTSEDFRITNINWQNVMLPMWFLTYPYKDKMYYFAMNGQTGKFGGILPINKGKLALFAFGIPFAAAIIIAALLTFIGV